MTGDYARWLENEIAMVLTFDRPAPGPETVTCTRCAARLVRDEHGGWARADEPERGRTRCPDGDGFWAFHEVADDDPQANPAPAGEKE